MVCRFSLVLPLALLPWCAFAQEPSFLSVDNPFQDERPITLGEPVNLSIQLAETQFLELSLTPRGEVEPGKVVKCQVKLTGKRLGSGKVEILPILLLENEDGEILERLNPTPFKVRGNKSFAYRDTLKVTGEALQAAAKIWIYLEVK